MISLNRRKILNMFEKLWRITVSISIRNRSFQCVYHSESLHTMLVRKLALGIAAINTFAYRFS